MALFRALLTIRLFFGQFLCLQGENRLFTTLVLSGEIFFGLVEVSHFQDPLSGEILKLLGNADQYSNLSR